MRTSRRGCYPDSRPTLGVPAQLPRGGIEKVDPLKNRRMDCVMLYTIVVVLLVLWLLGLVTSYTMGGLIHILLVIAIVVFFYNVLSSRRKPG